MPTDAPEVAEYFRRCEVERQRRLGTRWRLFGGPGTVFPNASPLARQPRTLAVWHPRGPHQTEAWRWYLVDALRRPGPGAGVNDADEPLTTEQLPEAFDTWAPFWEQGAAETAPGSPAP